MNADRMRVYKDDGSWVVDWGDPRWVVPFSSWESAVFAAFQIASFGGDPGGFLFRSWGRS